MNDLKKQTLSGILWGVATGIPGAVAGAYVGFSFFGLLLFSDTTKGESLIGVSVLIGFSVFFIISFLSLRRHEVASRMFRILIPIIFILVEILCGFLALYMLNSNSKRVSQTPSVIDSTLSGISRGAPGTYHVVANLNENSITCFCPSDGSQCKICEERGHLILAELGSSVLEVYPALGGSKQINNLIKDRTYYFTIEKKQFDSQESYYLRDFEPYGPTY